MLDARGALAEGATTGSVDLRAYYKALVSARVLDLRLSRMGLPMWASAAGEEAPAVAVAMLADDSDWIYPGGRDLAVAVTRGVPHDDVARAITGQARGGGPALPARVASAAHRIGTTTDALGMHLGFAAGQAHAQKLEGAGAITFALFGEGLTTAGVFHETVALAVRADLPLVLICKSQVWPEGAPPEAGLFGDSVEERAKTCGLWARRVDGADPIATREAIDTAAGRARRGRGPGLIEVVVTPVSRDAPPHRDPVERLRLHLDSLGEWTQTFQDVVEAEARQRIDSGLAEVGYRDEGEAS